jgi:hypothetical protein
MHIVMLLSVNEPDPLKVFVQIGSIVTAVVTFVTVVVTRFAPWVWTQFQTRSLMSSPIAEILTRDQIQSGLHGYVRPDCQDIDPAGGDEPRLVYGVRCPLFKAFDDFLDNTTEFRYGFLLADSGMGKTSALLNYYARSLRKVRRTRVALVPLNIPDADERIKSIPLKTETVLLLDALDEDTQAIDDHVARVRNLVTLTREFRRVLITCRTQFFSKDEEIPRRTGLINIGARAAGQPAEFQFHKLYLSPFSDAQVRKYIYRLYPFWRARMRNDGLKMIRKVPNLSVRPMLLAHIDDVLRSKRRVEYPFELYDEMISGWLIREQGQNNSAALADFSERLAVDLYSNRVERGAERVSAHQLALLADTWGIELPSWKLSGRSLLNRDAEGYYKFAHRSIMEYLFVRRLTRGEMACLALPWTDQMRQFFHEMLLAHFLRSQSPGGGYKIRVLDGTDVLFAIVDHLAGSTDVTERIQYGTGDIFWAFLAAAVVVLDLQGKGGTLEVAFVRRMGAKGLEGSRMRYESTLDVEFTVSGGDSRGTRMMYVNTPGLQADFVFETREGDSLLFSRLVSVDCAARSAAEQHTFAYFSRGVPYGMLIYTGPEGDRTYLERVAVLSELLERAVRLSDMNAAGVNVFRGVWTRGPDWPDETPRTASKSRRVWR